MRQNYLKNAVLLTGSSLVLRLAGMGFRIWLANRLGSEGLGLYQLILAMYSVFITLATSGVAVASTRLVTEELAHSAAAARRMVRLLCAVALALGSAAAAAQWFVAPTAARWWLGDLRAAAPLRTLAFSLPFMAFAAVLRGAFLALRRVEPNVVSQLVEQGFRIGVVVLLLQRLQTAGVALRCQAVLLGETLSEILSAGLMLLFYRGACRRHAEDEPTPPVRLTKLHADRRADLRRIWEILWPVEGSRCLASGLHTAENMLVPACLAVYLAAAGGRTRALEQYGVLKGMAMPLLFFPFGLLGSLATLLMPEITEAHVRGRRQTLRILLDRMLTLTMYASVLGGAFFFLWADLLGMLLYNSAEAGSYLRLLAPMAPVMYLESMVDGAIKGLGEQKASFGYTAWDSVLRIVGVLVLLPRMGMQGFLLVMIWSNLFTCFLNTLRLLRVSGLPLRMWRWGGAPCAAAVVSMTAAASARQLLTAQPPVVELAVGSLVMAAVYMAAAYPLGLGRMIQGVLQRRE